MFSFFTSKGSTGHPVGEKIEFLDKRFSDLASLTQMELTTNETDPASVTRHILSLPYRLRTHSLSGTSEHDPQTRNKYIMDRLFKYLNSDVWNFMDCGLLGHIVRLFGSAELKQKMEKYIADLSNFEKTTTISQLIDNWPGRREMPENYCNLVAKINKNPDKYTLKQLNSLRKDFCKQFLPPTPKSEFALLHSSFQRGSIIVKWFVAGDAVPTLMNSVMNPESAPFFVDYKIETVHIRDVLVYESDISVTGMRSVSCWLGDSFLPIFGDLARIIVLYPRGWPALEMWAKAKKLKVIRTSIC